MSAQGRIVLVEDNDATRYAVTRILAAAGYAVTPAADGATGLRLAATIKPDLVLLDVKLPDLSGFEIVRILKQDPETADIPVVHLSATSVTAAEQVRGLEGGADAYLTHPVDPRVLVATLNALLRARRAEARFQRVFETGLLGIARWDADGVVRDANDALLRLSGWTREDVAAGSVRWDALQVADPAAATPAVVGGPAERLLVTRDGRRVPVLVGGAAEEGDDAIAFVLDISERRRAEEALREADRRKDEFLAILSHELRNPLAPIRNSVYLLSRVDPGSPQAARARQVIERQSIHLTRLVDDLLDVTRISRGKIELRPVRLDLREVVRKTADDVRSMFDQRSVELEVELCDGPLWVNADPTRISQVVGNLLHNAMKFTPPNGEVVVAARSAGDRAEVVVHDTGIGIDPAELEHMFEPFAQADRTLARSQGGLGLGLALVLGLVRQHGGDVTARSEGLGHGAEFRVTLPLAPADAAAAAGARVDPARTALRILLVEDNPDAAQSLAEILQLKGHDVSLARDGRSGIATARELRPNVVLCDVGLPDISGYEVARTLRSDPALNGTRLVAISGYAHPEDHDRGRRAGFDAHLAKPASLETLDALLASVAKPA
ncbi:MAG TPA: response regulator [Anaeromyxobacter sp.]